MLRNSEVHRKVEVPRRTLCSMLLLLCLIVQITTTPIPALTSDHTDLPATNSTDDYTDATLDNDLYVIKAVVYEIGILTDADNTTVNATERQEEVKISFYDRSNSEDDLSKHTQPIVPETLFFDPSNGTL